MDSNHPKIQDFIDRNIFPKTIYRIINSQKHNSLLQLLYFLKYKAPEQIHNIHLKLNSSELITSGKLKLYSEKPEYILKLKIRSIIKKDELLDQYHKVPQHIKEIGYNMYDDIFKVSFIEPIKLSSILKKYPYSKSNLYPIFQSVIGAYPSEVWRDRRLLDFLICLYWSKQVIRFRNFPISDSTIGNVSALCQDLSLGGTSC